MFVAKFCRNFVPRREYNDAYMNLSTEWNYQIQQRPVDWLKLQELYKELAKLFGYHELRVVEAIKNRDIDKIYFLH